jgi:hypothetical protein
MSENLYHYTTFEKFIDGICETNTLRLNPIQNVNDPIDYKERLFKNNQLFSKGKAKNSIINGYSELKKTLKEEWIEKCKILCFSKDNNEDSINGFQLANLWSYYAENHSGVCLKFNKSKTIEYFESNFKHCFPLKNDIEYKRQIGHFNFDTNYLNCAFLGIKENKKPLFFEKLIMWDREQEYRLVCFSKNEYEYLPINEILTEIILGQKTSKESELIIRNKFPKTPISKMNYSIGCGEFEKRSIDY